MYDMSLETSVHDFEAMSEDEYDYMMMEQEEEEWVDEEVVKIYNDDEQDAGGDDVHLVTDGMGQPRG